MKQGRSQSFSRYDGKINRAGSSDIWLLVLFIGLSVSVGCIIQCCGNRQETERETRDIQFNARASQVGSGLAELEWKVGHADGLSDEDREAMLEGVRELRKDYESVLQDFQRIRAEERAAGESQVQQLWTLDRLGNQGAVK